MKKKSVTSATLYLYLQTQKDCPFQPCLVNIETNVRQIYLTTKHFNTFFLKTSAQPGRGHNVQYCFTIVHHFVKQYSPN